MLAEAIQYAATFAVTPREFRPHIRSSVSLWSRAGRCAAAWAEHEHHCRHIINDTAGRMRQRRTAVVLGSGLLRDVSVANLSRGFDTVVLVDLVHPASVRLGLRGRGLRNVCIISRDLSGLDQALSGQPVEPLSFLRQVPYLDLVISSNLLSQIGVGAERRLQDERGDPSPDLVARLIAAHVDGLVSLPCSTILLTDTSYKVADRSGVTHEEKDLLHGIRLPEPQQTWSWPVVPFGEDSRDYEVVHQVAAISQLR